MSIGGRWPQQSSRDELSSLRVVIRREWHDLGDRTIPIAHDDLLALSYFPQILSESVPQVRDVGAAHDMAMVAMFWPPPATRAG